MKILLLLTLTLNLVGCGKNLLKDLFDHDTPYNGTRHTTDPIFIDYLDQLDMSHHTPIIFNARGEGIAGTCTKWDNYRVIEIDREYWDTRGDTYRLELLAHELGHCDYNLPHNNDTFLDNTLTCPESVMMGINFGGSCWTNNFDHYMSIF